MKSSAVKVPPQLESELSRVMARRSFDVLFQPIVDSVSARIVGYEALTRAPADSPLHAPAVLFDVAAAVGRLVELERLVLRRIVTRFAELGLPGLLFVNVTADTAVYRALVYGSARTATGQVLPDAPGKRSRAVVSAPTRFHE